MTLENEAVKENMLPPCLVPQLWDITCKFMPIFNLLNAFIPLFCPLQLPVAPIRFSRHILISSPALGLHILYLQPFATYLCPSCTALIFSPSHSQFSTSSLHSSGSLLTPVTVQCCGQCWPWKTWTQRVKVWQCQKQPKSVRSADHL